MRIKAVLFDLYGTLAGFDPPREQIQIRAGQEHGLELEPAGVLAGYAEADDFMARQNATSPLRSMSAEESVTFFARYEQIILRHAGAEVSEERAAAVWSTVRRQKYDLALFDDVLPAVSALKWDGRRVGVVSNMAEPGETVARRLGLEGRVDFLITSKDAGANKPHPPIFLRALDEAGTDAGEAILVGDSIDSDVAGASGVGIRPVLIDRDARYGGYSDHPRITGLAELPGVMDAMEGR